MYGIEEMIIQDIILRYVGQKYYPRVEQNFQGRTKNFILGQNYYEIFVLDQSNKTKIV